jgi:carbon monoxide dehydrogenase subunit G
MIEVSERIDVPAAPSTVWGILSDPRAVVDCVPGAALGEQHEDGSFDATLTVKFGPAKVTFRARVAIEFDEAAMAGRVTSKGKDKQGGTRFTATMSFKVLKQAEPPGSAIPIEAEVEIGGRLATLVESGAALVVKRMTGEFSERLVARCRPAGQRGEMVMSNGDE